jgi:hypothetical protein
VLGIPAEVKGQDVRGELVLFIALSLKDLYHLSLSQARRQGFGR